MTMTLLAVAAIVLLLLFGGFAIVGFGFKLVGGIFELVFGLFGIVLGAIGTVIGLLIGGIALLFAGGIVLLVFGALALPLLLPLAVIAGIVWLVVRAASPRPQQLALPPPAYREAL